MRVQRSGRTALGGQGVVLATDDPLLGAGLGEGVGAKAKRKP
ncbi:MAG: hypothetical protein RMJ84_07965 [Sandaracinaceae bacterium]|nr:hypothetical protein [Sandaracinaceae bacterium]